MDVDEFLAKVGASRLHKHLYHFTDKRNLGSIRKHGLLSAKRAAAKGVKIIAPGGNDWSQEADEICGMDEYVHLCLTDDHPMEFRAKQTGHLEEVVYLRIRPEVIKLDGVLMSDDISNKRGVRRLSAPELLRELDHEVLYERTDWKDSEIKERRKAAKKFEVLVPDAVSLKYITNLGDS
jgi:predicted metalloprotease